MKRDQEEKAEWIKYLEGNRCNELGWVGSQWQKGGEAALGVVGDAMRFEQYVVAGTARMGQVSAPD
jgi:hypothetical protein